VKILQVKKTQHQTAKIHKEEENQGKGTEY
jgi:hypothetical protein